MASLAANLTDERFCPACGTRGVSAFCPNDGTEMKTVEHKVSGPLSAPIAPASAYGLSPSATNPRRMSRRILAAILVVILIVVVSAGALSYLLAPPVQPPADYSTQGSQTFTITNGNDKIITIGQATSKYIVSVSMTASTTVDYVGLYWYNQGSCSQITNGAPDKSWTGVQSFTGTYQMSSGFGDQVMLFCLRAGITWAGPVSVTLGWNVAKAM